MSNLIQRQHKGASMRILNNSKLNLSHDKYYLEVGKSLDVPKEVAEIWLKFDGVEKFIAPEDIEAEKAKAVAEALKEERAKVAAKSKAKKKK